MLNFRLIIIYFVLITYSLAGTKYYLVNPVETRNIIGNYAILGNTAECVTVDKIHFGARCEHSDLNKYDNKYMVKYIDIDNNSKTWNSTSSNFTIPSSAIDDKNGSIVWAGLFWQGNINNYSQYYYYHGNIDDRTNQRRAYLYNNQIRYINLPYYSVSAIDLKNTDANKVLIKVDNGDYEKIEASTMDIHRFVRYGYGVSGGTYGSYADITNLIVSKKLKKGKHTITVANITANEGRDPLLGDFAGWCMVVIYKEGFGGKPRNISIFNGYTPISVRSVSKRTLSIKGFKLPKKGDVSAQYSVFAGEGEWAIGKQSYKYDKMTISKTKNGPQDQMPNVKDPTNIFDGRFTSNIKRDNVGDNNLVNNNSLDIDSYDVSSIMTRYRNENENINEVFISLSSNQDYYTPSMLAFSAQLYAPKICYDTDVKLGDYINVNTQDRYIDVDDFEQLPLRIKVMLRNKESDFDLLNSKLRIKFSPDENLSYIAGKSTYSPPNTFVYYPAKETDTNIGQIAIGDRVTKEGGTLSAFDTTYAKLYYKFLADGYKGKFDIVVDAKLSFDGIRKVNYTMSTSVDEDSVFHIGRCNVDPVYNPYTWHFNVERGDSTFDQDEPTRYSLYTQVVGVPYEVTIASYGKDVNGKYNKPKSFSGVVELELLDASTFENNSSAGYDSICEDPDTYNKGAFIKLNNQKRSSKIKIPDDFATYPKNLALRNAVFRVWSLITKENNQTTIVKHNCLSQDDASCFEKVYVNYYKNNRNINKAKYCETECTSSQGDQCYNCLRSHFGKPTCSRDNFSIRPESYRISLNDNNQTNSTQSVQINSNNNRNINNLSAGYLYNLNIEATKFGATNEYARGYFLNVNGKSSTKEAIALFSDKATCKDKKNHNIKIHMFNGKTHRYESLKENRNTPQNGLIIRNSGKYKLHIQDSEWTKVDQKGYAYKPFKDRADCIENSTDVYYGGLNSQRGCLIKSNHGSKYYDLSVSMHPYSFILNNLALRANPNSSAGYIYINDLNKTKSLISNSKVMALNLNTTITAIGKDKTILTNYTKDCSAQNLSINLNYDTLEGDKNKTIKDSLEHDLEAQYSIYVQGIDSSVNVNKVNGTSMSVNYDKKYFDKTSAGSAIFNEYFNFKRSFNGAVNPFTVYFKDFNLQSTLDKSTVDLNKNHIPVAYKTINSKKTVYYAKAKSLSDFYDDIDRKIVKTPIIITLFCDKSLEYCEKYGINTSTSKTSEFDWWVSKNHSVSRGEGKVELKTNDNNKVIVVPSLVDSFLLGVNKDVQVEDKGITIKPYIATISPTDNMKNNYPWLLFNKNKNEAPKYLYKVKFIDTPTAWSGEGKTGHTIDVNASGRKNNKIEW